MHLDSACSSDLTTHSSTHHAAKPLQGSQKLLGGGRFLHGPRFPLQPAVYALPLPCPASVQTPHDAENLEKDLTKVRAAWSELPCLLLILAFKAELHGT